MVWARTSNLDNLCNWDALNIYPLNQDTSLLFLWVLIVLNIVGFNCSSKHKLGLRCGDGGCTLT